MKQVIDADLVVLKKKDFSFYSLFTARHIEQ